MYFERRGEAAYLLAKPAKSHHAVHALAKLGREDIDRQLGPSSLSYRLSFARNEAAAGAFTLVLSSATGRSRRRCRRRRRTMFGNGQIVQKVALVGYIDFGSSWLLFGELA